MFADTEQMLAYERRAGSLLRYTPKDFRPYQLWMAKVATSMPGVYLAADMGLGKTATSLFAAYMWRLAFGVRRVLVVAPKHVAEQGWPTEIAQWSFARQMPFVRFLGSDSVRRRDAAWRREDAYLHITNRENLPWLLSRVPEGYYDALIYDEASRFKSGRIRTQRRGVLTELGHLIRRRAEFQRLVLLSGTPTPNGVIDLWGPIRLLDGGARLGRSRNAFLQRWFVKSMWSRRWLPKDGASQEIYDLIGDIFFALRSEDYVELPELVEVDVPVVLSPSTMAQYRRLMRTKVLAEENIDATNAAVLASKLLQLANGYVYDDDGEPRWFHEEKLKRLEALVEHHGDRPILVFYNYRFDLAALKKRFPKAEYFGERADQVRRWNEGKIRMLLLHPQSAGHGLNLQHGGNVCVWFGLPWSLELYQQANKRLHRPGQRQRVIVHRLLAKGTYDERVAQILSGKGKQQKHLFDSLKAEIDLVQEEEGV